MVVCTLVRLVIHRLIHDVRLTSFTVSLFLDSGYILRNSLLTCVKKFKIRCRVRDHGIMFFFSGPPHCRSHFMSDSEAEWDAKVLISACLPPRGPPMKFHLNHVQIVFQRGVPGITVLS